MFELITAALFLEYFRIIYLFFSNMPIARRPPPVMFVYQIWIRANRVQYVTDNDADFNYLQSSFRMCMIYSTILRGSVLIRNIISININRFSTFYRLHVFLEFYWC